MNMLDVYIAVFCGVYPASPAAPASLRIGSQIIGFSVSIHTNSLNITKPIVMPVISARIDQIAAFSIGWCCFEGKHAL